MKKLVLLIFVIGINSLLRSQLPNPGFENLNPNGTIKNWGRSPLLSGGGFIDSTGFFTTDSIVYDNDFYFSTPDAHSGTKALEMRNAYNYPTGQKYPGSARVSQNDSDYAAFITFVNIPQEPDLFTFYYKFLPVNNDTALAMLGLYDSLGTQVGESIIEITGTVNTYSQMVHPITYFGTGTVPSFVTVNFVTAKYGTVPNFGTRFLVDDVALTNTVTTVYTGISNSTKANTIYCFPNPVEDQLMIRLPGKNTFTNATVRLNDISGKTIQLKIINEHEPTFSLDVKDLAKGMYSIDLITNETSYHTKFIK